MNLFRSILMSIVNSCIQQSLYCSMSEHDILGIRTESNRYQCITCIGHGACFHACPTEAITLRIGTEKRGIEFSSYKSEFETNVPGVLLLGELGGMGLIKNSVEQGRQALKILLNR